MHIRNMAPARTSSLPPSLRPIHIFANNAANRVALWPPRAQRSAVAGCRDKSDISARVAELEDQVARMQGQMNIGILYL
eukprot:SAG31_NODE_1320_length_8809_cov_4.243398_6_plen_79_part_00